MRLLGRIVCAFKGHMRGKFQRMDLTDKGQINFYECRRCGTAWTRKGVRLAAKGKK